MAEKFSTIKIRDPQESKTVEIRGELNPDITKKLISKWQSFVDIIAKIANVPSGLIMKLNENSIQVFIKSNTEGNPYEEGEEAKLIYGLYCETVIGTQNKLVVPNARKSSTWKDNNPDVDINMISYLGYPINWPNGNVFGTVCLLDNKENKYNKNIEELLSNVKNSLERDLELLMVNQNLENKNSELVKVNNIKAKFLSLISHDIRGSIGSLNEFLNFYLDHPSSFDQKELIKLLTMLSGSANATYNTLESLLDWSKNELLEFKANKQQLNLIDLIKNVIAFFQQNIELKKLKLSTDFFSTKALVSVDEKMMETAFRNVLSNAIKYTEIGGDIYIRVSHNNNTTCVEIEDSGIGMSPKSIANLFKYYENHQKEGTHRESSSGIGLMITKEFLDKNGAQINVLSEIGKGTKIKILI